MYACFESRQTERRLGLPPVHCDFLLMTILAARTSALIGMHPHSPDSDFDDTGAAEAQARPVVPTESYWRERSRRPKLDAALRRFVRPRGQGPTPLRWTTRRKFGAECASRATSMHLALSGPAAPQIPRLAYETSKSAAIAGGSVEGSLIFSQAGPSNQGMRVNPTRRAPPPSRSASSLAMWARSSGTPSPSRDEVKITSG